MTNNLKKIISMSGLCANCKNEKTCNFIKDIKIFMTNKRCAEKVLDTEMTIYSCDNYEIDKSIYPEYGMCLSCKQEV